jgi:uncharacterized membrane protein
MKLNSPVYKLLLLMAGFIIALLAIRIKLSGSVSFIFLVWNLFLAWIPFEISRHIIPKNKKWLNTLLLPVWFLFFPNALYIITDLIHIRNYSHHKIPDWFDAILLFASALLGLALAFLSLRNIENFASHFINKKWMGWLLGGLLLTASFGVYLGRFLRWNSWDIVRNPGGLVMNIAERFLYPFEHIRTWAVTFTLFGLFSIMYLFLKTATGFAIEKNKPERPSH